MTAEPIGSSSNISISIEQPQVGDGNYTTDDSAISGNFTQGASVEVGNYTQEVVTTGDLDPRTGVFYTDKDGNLTVGKSTGELQKKAGIVVSVGTSQSSQQVLRTEEIQTSESGKNYDLLSSSLAQAQIDLDPFQFIEDGSLSKGVSSSESSVDIPIGEQIVQADTISLSSTSSASVPGELEKVPKSGIVNPFFCNFWEGTLGPFRLGKVVW